MTTTPDNADHPPEVDIHGPRSKQLPPASNAGERILEFVSWFGDGEVMGEQYEGDNPPLYARDLEAAAKAARAPRQPVVEVERIRAAIKLLYPDEMTPSAKNVLEKILAEA